MNPILYLLQDKLEHLELLDGVVIDLLKTKWDTFVKSRFYKQFYMFSFYFLFSLVSFISRPGPKENEEDGDDDQEKVTDKPNVTSNVIGRFSAFPRGVTNIQHLPYSKFP